MYCVFLCLASTIDQHSFVCPLGNLVYYIQTFIYFLYFISLSILKSCFFLKIVFIVSSKYNVYMYSQHFFYLTTVFIFRLKLKLISPFYSYNINGSFVSIEIYTILVVLYILWLFYFHINPNSPTISFGHCNNFYHIL